MSKIQVARPLSTALVIGASGFWGSWLTHSLESMGVKVTGLSRTEHQGVGGLRAPSRIVRADVQDANLESALAQQDAVFYLAGRASVPASVSDPLGDLDANVRSVVRVLAEIAKSSSPMPFIYASSAAVYGTSQTSPMSESHPLGPISPYGVSKLSAEAYVRLYATQYGVPSASVRPFSIYGPGQEKQVVFDLSRRILRGDVPLHLLGSPDVSRDFIYVSDAASAIVMVAKNAPLVGEAYNIASGDETTLGWLARELLRISNSDGTPSFSGSVRSGDPEHWRADIRAIRALGFEPKVALPEGLAATYRWVSSSS